MVHLFCNIFLPISESIRGCKIRCPTWLYAKAAAATTTTDHFFHHGKIGASPRTKRRRGILGMDGMLNLGLHI